MSVIKEFLFSLGWKVDNSGLDDTEEKGKKAAKGVADEWKKAGKTIGKTLTQVAAGAVAAAAGVFKLAESAAAAGDKTAKAAKQAGVAADQYQRVAFALERSGGSAAGLDRALRTMTLNLENAATKGSGPLADGLERIGLRAEDLLGLSLEDRLAAIADRLALAGDESRQSAVAMQLFGAKGGAELKVLLDEGGAGIRALGDEAERLGLVMGDDALAASEEFTDAVHDLKRTLGALMRDVGLSIVPTVQNVIGRIKEWAVSNRELIATRVEEVIRAVMTALEQLIPPMLEFLPLAAELVRLGAEIASNMGPGGATAALIGLRAAMAGSLGPAGLLATALATIVSTLINMQVKAQDARFALDDLLQGGRGKRGEGTRKLVSKREGQLQQQRRALASRVKELTGRNALKNVLRDGEAFPENQKGIFELGKRRDSQKAAAMARIREIDKEIAAERGRAQKEEERFGPDVFTGPNLADAGSDRVPKSKKGGGKRRKETDITVAATKFGEQIRRLAEKGGVGEVAIKSALEAGQTSLNSGAADKVALRAALGRLGSLTGQDLTSKKGKKGGDPLLSAILGDENVPDIELSSIARGANPQTLISNITNNITIGDTNIEVQGAGNPGDVASETQRRFDERLRDIFSKASKTARPPFLR